MNEIEVILDVRQAPGSLDLLVVRQKVSAEGGNLHLIGSPSESKIPLSLRKAKVTLNLAADTAIGHVLLAHVQNVGLAFLDNVKVQFAWQFPQAQDGLQSLPSAREVGQGMNFIPTDPEQMGPVVPGETRDYYLPAEYVEMAARVARDLPLDQYQISVKSGPDELARVPGGEVAALLRVPTDGRRVQIDRRLRTLLEALSPEDKQAADAALTSLNEVDPTKWHGAQQLPGNKQIYLLRISPELKLVVRCFPATNTVEVMDIIRAASSPGRCPGLSNARPFGAIGPQDSPEGARGE